MPSGGKPSGSFTLSKKIGAAKAHEITTVEDFVVGYRNREETSLLKPNTLVAGSHDVLSDVMGMVESRLGYTIDGGAAFRSNVSSITRAPYDWETTTGLIQHLRAGGLTEAGDDGQLQIRYEAPDGTVSWLPLLIELTSTRFNYTPYWDVATLKGSLLMVNGGQNIWEWSGAFAIVASNTSTTITSNSTQTFAQLGFQFSNTTAGDATTVYDMTNPSGDTIRYTYNSGTDPMWTSSTTPIGTYFTIQGVRAGTYPITGIGSDYFEIQSSNHTTGLETTGAVTYDGGYAYNIIVNGVTYTYTAGAQFGNTLLGLTGLPTFTVGTPFYQAPISYNFFGFTFGGDTFSPPGIFTCDLLGTLNNQVFVGSTNTNLLYMSKAGNFMDYTETAVARLQGDGGVFTTLGALKAIIPQEEDLYISAGLSEWYNTKFVDTTIVDQNTGEPVVTETAQLEQLKTTAGQATISQYATTKMKNNVVFISNEPIVNSLGRVSNILLTPQTVDLSFPIVNDMNNYDFTDAYTFYFKQFIYMAVPKEGLFRVYNMTNPKNPYWEAPQSISLGGFSAVGNQLLGHSYDTFESYILFNGSSDRADSLQTVGLPISCNATFALQTAGLRAKFKSFNKFFTEGFMSPNTKLTVNLTYRMPFPGTFPNASFTLDGSASYVLKNVNDNSLGKFSLGKAPLGTDDYTVSQTALPPYFAVFKTFTRQPYLDYQPSFTSDGVSQTWRLLSYGTNAAPTSENENYITI